MMPNPAVERDAAKARRLSTLRYAPFCFFGLSVPLVTPCRL